MSFSDNEPLITAGGLVGLFGAVLVLLVSFGVHLTDDQQKALVAVVTLIAPLAAAWIARGHVMPVSKLEQTSSGQQALRQAEATK